jgi:hypothetical protein
VGHVFAAKRAPDWFKVAFFRSLVFFRSFVAFRFFHCLENFQSDEVNTLLLKCGKDFTVFDF